MKLLEGIEKRKWTLSFNSNYDDGPPIVESGPKISGYEGEVDVIDSQYVERLERMLAKAVEQRDEWLLTDYKGDEINQREMNEELRAIAEGR